MPEYLAPGVYVEETSYRAKSIEGVSTSTAGFVGPTRFGPSSGKPEVLTSFADYQRSYGGLEDLGFGTNYVAHAARAFFEEGGARLYVSRVIGAGAQASTATQGDLTVRARYVGAAGDVLVTFRLAVGADVLTATASGPALTRVRNHDSVVVLGPAGFVVREARRDALGHWTLDAGDGSVPAPLGGVVAVYPLAISVDIAKPTVDSRGLPTFTQPVSYGPFSLSPAAPDGVWQTFGLEASSEAPPIVFGPRVPANAPTVSTLTAAVFPAGWLASASPVVPPAAPQPVTISLSGGVDGAEPTALAHEGNPDDVTGLAAFAAIEDISIVAAPGSTQFPEARGIRQAVITHCENLRYRVAVLDVPRNSGVNAARGFRNETSSTRAAIYYPWVTVMDPFQGTPLLLPPSGFVAGIWARNDITHAVFKAPANEVIRSAIDLERRLTKGQQDVLNPEGVNCLRFFAGRGNLVWGARTMSDDPEWKYVSVRRYFAYLEHSIERGTQWAVFENNGDALWANVRRTIEDFLLVEWKMGALLGVDPKDAFFVRCDRTTMLQGDLDNGRLICLIGVAVVKPAEFVIFRIGQWTATAGN
jgi:phage tail sheath protein FI